MMKIYGVMQLGETFTHQVLPLRYTPRKIQVHPETGNLVILELEHACYSYKERLNIKGDIVKMTKDEVYRDTDERSLGSYPKANRDSFACCIRIVDPITLETLYLEEFESNEVVFSHFIA